jgi:hypothetical protein
MLQFGDKAAAAAKKFLVEGDRSKTSCCSRALQFCGKGVAG